MITTEQVKELRKKTGISVMYCKKALEKTKGDMEKAIAILRKESGATANKKSKRDLKAGAVQAYIHNSGNIGAMALLSSETDFVAKNEEFIKLAYDIAMHIAASDPEDTETLLGQEYIKDNNRTIKDLIESATQKFGERIQISEFVRFAA